MKLTTRFAAVLAAGALVLAGCGNGTTSAGSTGGGSTNGTITVRWGIPSGTYLPLYVADDLGYFKDAGINAQFVNFQTGAPLLAGLKSDSLDVVTTGLASVFALGQGIPLKYIVWEGDASAGEGLIARKGTGITSIQDLGKAKSIGAATGTCAQVSLYYAAKKVGLDYSKLNIRNVAPNLYANAFTSASLDAGISWSPFIEDLQQRGNTIAGWDKEWMPDGGACPEMVIARPDFLKEHPDLPQRILEAHHRAVLAIEKNPQLAYDALVKHLSLTPQVAKAAADRYLADYPTLQKQVDPSSRFSLVGDKGLVAQLTTASDALAALKVIPAAVAPSVIRDAVDPSYIQKFLESGQGTSSSQGGS